MRKARHERVQGSIVDALNAGDLEKVKAHLQGGVALPEFALLLAVQGRAIRPDPGLLPLLQFLIEQGAALNQRCVYGQSVLLSLSREARFDAVALLLQAGADPARLAWTALTRAVALGTLDDVLEQIEAGAELEATDDCARTAWLLAVHIGDLDKARVLQQAGASLDVVGHCGVPPLSYAAQSRSPDMLAYVLQCLPDVDAIDSFGKSALAHAAERGDLDVVDWLLAAGAAVDRLDHIPATALWYTYDAAVARRLLAAGADPLQLQRETRRSLLGLPAQPQPQLLNVNAEQFARSRHRRFGRRNAESMSDPFWLAMIRSGLCGWSAAKHYGRAVNWQKHEPIWSAERHGQTITELPDGRIVQIGGEHEDSYDPDFCIYNDVFVHHPDGRIDIYGYPRDEFAPTDFHTATLLGRFIYIVGCLGYREDRHYGHTPVYQLDTRDWRMRPLHLRGESPGWINSHVARQIGPEQIEISGGKRLDLAGVDGVEREIALTGRHVLDVGRKSWS